MPDSRVKVNLLQIQAVDSLKPPNLTTPQIPVMVEFTLPEEWPEVLYEVLPQQRAIVDRLMAKGIIKSYSLSQDQTRIWMVFIADNAQNAIAELIAEWPILEYVTYQTVPLLFTNDSSSVMHYSLN